MECRDLLMRIFVPKPAERIKMDGMMAHPWVARDAQPGYVFSVYTDPLISYVAYLRGPLKRIDPHPIFLPRVFGLYTVFKFRMWRK